MLNHACIFYSRICGYVFDADAANLAIHAIAGAIVTACTWQTPFKWGVRFDSSEIQGKYILRQG